MCTGHYLLSLLYKTLGQHFQLIQDHTLQATTMLKKLNVCTVDHGPIFLLVDEITSHLVADFRGLKKAWTPVKVVTALHESGSTQNSFLPPSFNHTYKVLVLHTNM